MHIVYLTHEYPQPNKPHGGIGSFVQTLARRLVKQGIQVSVVGVASIAQEVSEDDHGVSVYRLPSSRWRVARFIGNAKAVNRKLWQLHRESTIDIVEGAELAFAFIDKRLPVKRIIRMHGGHHFFATTLGNSISRWRAWQERQSFASATHICAVSQFVANQTAELLKLNADSITVIYNPVSMDRFYKSDSSKIEPRSLLFIGTVCQKKGVIQLIESLRSVKAIYPDVHLKLVGRDWRGKDCGSYVEFIKSTTDREMLDMVTFVGPVNHHSIPALIERAEVCVYPSLMESQGIVVLEAMAMAKAPIFMKHGPGSEIISQGVTGLLCDSYSPESIAEKILYMLDHPQEAQKMGEAARQDVLNRFDIELLVKQNVGFYNQCLSQ